MRASITWAIAVLTFTACAPAQQAPLDPGLSPAVAAAVRNEPDARPRLVVMLAIDQFRADYLTRLHDLFGNGGFKRLTTDGAWFTSAHHDHYPLKTSPGHAAMLTGGAPYKTGIISNSWWDATARQSVESTDQSNAVVVGADPKSKEKPAGPANLRCTTVGDELKLATAGRARVVSISLKSTAAVLMGGHAADAAIWFDDVGGRWISSTAYCRQTTGPALPAWVTAINDERIPSKSLGTKWECSLTPQVLKERTKVPTRVSQALPKEFGTVFPHTIGAEDKTENYTAFTYTPASNAFVLQTAQRAVVAEKLGQRGGAEGDGRVPDLLAVSLSANDTVGHAFGPYSPEAIDIMVRTDAMLADFFTFLDDKVGKGKYLVAVTGDHGVVPIPEDAAAPEIGTPARRFKPGVVVAFINDVLTARYGPPAGSIWFSHYEDPRRHLTSNGGVWVDGGVYLSREATDALQRSGKIASLRDVEQLVCDAVNSAGIPGVYGCFGKKQILEGRVADNDLRRHLSLGVHPQLSPDLIILEDQLCLPGEGNSSVTNHGTPYAYDTHVPVILYQPGVIKPGVFAQRVSTMDIAPTISLLIGTELPSACDGKPLLPALTK